mmetsp:Transcript_14102/g.34479  ORF Transcript_14102/g.34479 Transcript_14102/m.34479 type:complete len:639 (-) Transcript_14102:74-1990(-)|eukprot:CAMPEP_0206233984 /NCGR_PEP_ID=MMETSP0047_2-20121206/12321_1 /ASSEMBLY_ACC=CAM_ASM_000192 /TAXON_ID=195065 /ORGANISM="Chroomonas mesostigmatica_cf, Strain CCMP1168" /LENGTH=638 /DNA_ID=CAMNT_0053657985 /DNA_START=83 /DNA_END=1999 /DNA_ORIENTATION=+
MSGVLKYTRKDLADLTYHPVRPLDVISAEIGIPVEEMAKLDANENLHPVPAEMMTAVTEALASLSSGCSAQIYPDPTQSNFRKDIAAMHNLTPEHVVGGSGSDDILDIIMRLIDAKNCIICPPTFGMYKFLGAISKIEIVEVGRKENFEVDVPAVCAAIKKNKCKLVILPSPNNPTGTLLPNDDIEILCKEDAIIVIDEAYADFAGCSADELLSKYPNLIVCRTFSKWAGLAGLRAGYALGDPKIIERMLAIKQPYNVNVAAEAMARSAIAHREKILVTVRSLLDQRDRMIAFLEKYRFLRPYKTHSNFVLCDVLDVDAAGLQQFLRKKGVLVRYFGTQGGQLQNNIRISAGRPADTDKLIAALEAFEKERYNVKAAEELEKLKDVECLVFDMDGVLVDVSQSYRTAIVQTCAHFGANVTNEDVSAAKAKGDANNDWKLTHKLISEKVEKDAPTLEQVTEEFEKLYQGTKETKGLNTLEKLLPPLSVLEKLAERYPLALVTGRPRKPDCETALKIFDLGKLFDAVVCMEDAVVKPDPAPVKLALEKLGCKTGIMFGDTVDDARAAVGAGIKAAGVIPPGHSAEVDTPILEGAGASFVLSPGMAELGVLLKGDFSPRKRPANGAAKSPAGGAQKKAKKK